MTKQVTSFPITPVHFGRFGVGYDSMILGDALRPNHGQPFRNTVKARGADYPPTALRVE
jgi:hypothetical protein